MSNTIPLQIVEILPTKVWIESGIMGERVVMRQHEGDAPFEYCVFNYNYAHTSNAQTMSDATAIAMSLTNERPIEHRQREYAPMPEAAHAAAVSAAKDAEIAQLRADAIDRQNNVVVPLRERVRVLEDALTGLCIRSPGTNKYEDALSVARAALEKS